MNRQQKTLKHDILCWFYSSEVHLKVSYFARDDVTVKPGDKGGRGVPPLVTCQWQGREGGWGGENSQFCADMIFEWPLINVTEHPTGWWKYDIDGMEIVMEGTEVKGVDTTRRNVTWPRLVKRFAKLQNGRSYSTLSFISLLRNWGAEMTYPKKVK